MKRIFLFLFLIVSALEILSQIFQWENVHHLSKPFIIIFLGAYYFVSVDRVQLSKLVLLALVLSFTGDSLLMYESRNSMYFIGGLAAFLVAHVSYIFAFREHRSDERTDQLHGVQRVRMAFPVILAATGLVVVLYPHLGDLKLPVVIYALTIMLMVLAALFRYQRTVEKSFWKVAAGAVLFLISDSVLAINKFLEPIQNAGVIIMLTYITAQFLIVRGLLQHRVES